MSEEYSSLSSDFKGLLLSLDGRLTKTADLTQELFTEQYESNGLTKDKKLVIKEGSSKEEVFVIEKGETHVIRRTAKGYLPLLTLEKGDIFGCVPFMDMGHEPRRASVVASKGLKVSQLDTKSIQAEYDRLSETFRKLIDGITTCVSLTTNLACHLHERR
jgi:signal-transduction protein with cAMP-binding, CBS, and nucleotidyltransferase domain